MHKDLIKQFLKTPHDGKLANRLLSDFHRGEYGEADLISLLDSDDLAVVRSATWIASELPNLLLSRLDVPFRLLSHESKYARFYAIEIFKANQMPCTAALVEKLIEMLSDGERAVRWKAADYLAELNSEDLRALIHEGVGNFARETLNVILESDPEKIAFGVQNSKPPYNILWVIALRKTILLFGADFDIEGLALDSELDDMVNP